MKFVIFAFVIIFLFESDDLLPLSLLPEFEHPAKIITNDDYCHEMFNIHFITLLLHIILYASLNLLKGINYKIHLISILLNVFNILLIIYM